MYDAIIIGAGVSGLHAAWKLEQAGKNVLVLEARGRIGGRILSANINNNNDRLDLGATWIWPGEWRVDTLIKELGLKTFTQYEKGSMLYDSEGGTTPIPQGGSGVLSLRIKGGIASITDSLAHKLRAGSIKLSHEVKAIVLDKDGSIKVDADDDRSYLSRNILLAIPPALAINNIKFFPQLPQSFSQIAAITPVWMGVIIKTVIVYETPFWRDAGYSGTVMSTLGPLQEIHDMCGEDGSPAALFGFSALQNAEQNAPVEHSVVQQLIRIFGKAASKPRGLIIQDWSKEVYTSRKDVAYFQDYSLFGDSIYDAAYLGGGLHFCSCETYGRNGHIEDALAASDRAVKAALRNNKIK